MTIQYASTSHGMSAVQTVVPSGPDRHGPRFEGAYQYTGMAASMIRAKASKGNQVWRWIMRTWRVRFCTAARSSRGSAGAAGSSVMQLALHYRSIFARDKS